jgi:hypothetical protein
VRVFAAVGDLVGNWSWTVWLLIPLVVGFALLTALSLGPEEPAASESGGVERGVSRFLASRTDAAPTQPGDATTSDTTDTTDTTDTEAS